MPIAAADAPERRLRSQAASLDWSNPTNWTREHVLAAQAREMSEKQLDECLIACLNLHGWRHYHTYDSRRSERGFPDRVAVREQRVLTIETKSERGRIRPEQEEWLRALWDSGRVEVYLWRPSDWLSGRIEEVLR